ncbi:MAG: sialidase family protein, partial [Holophagae bacterium]
MATVLVVCGGSVVAAADGPARSGVKVVQPDGANVMFESWQEAGRRWTSISKDGGTTWSEPRAMSDVISLRAGTLVPGSSQPVVPKSIPVADDNRVFLVQFETQSLSAWRDQLRGLGAEVLVWVPYNAHIVRMDPELVATVEALPFVRWVGPYEPAYRTDPNLLDGLDASNVLMTRYNVMTYVSGAAEKAQLSTEVGSIGGQ